MCCHNVQNHIRSGRKGYGDQCCTPGHHHGNFPGMMSKKKKIKILEEQLAGMREEANDLEELIAELKADA